MPNLGPTELIIILLIVIAIFGAGKIASIGGALGRGVRDFRKEVKSGPDDEDFHEPEEPEPVSKQEPEAEDKEA